MTFLPTQTVRAIRNRSFKENLACAKPLGAGGSLSCPYTISHQKLILSDSVKKASPSNSPQIQCSGKVTVPPLQWAA